jgi:serine/threonine protein kinase
MQRNDDDTVRSGSRAAGRPDVPDWIGRFRVTARLGEGGMGRVFAARDPALERPVAIKVIRRELLDDDTARQRFWREARIVADVTDPRLCRVHEVREHGGQLFIVMELLEGESLAGSTSGGSSTGT